MQHLRQTASCSLVKAFVDQCSAQARFAVCCGWRPTVKCFRTQNDPRCAETEQVIPADTLLHNASSKAERFDGRAFRRGLGKTGRYIRNPINDKDSLALMETHGVGYSTTGLVAQMRESDTLWQFKDITIKLANAYGYCWGVERAVQMAYEARKAYPGQKLYVTNEIIHNPAVNQVRSVIEK